MFFRWKIRSNASFELAGANSWLFPPAAGGSVRNEGRERLPQSFVEVKKSSQMSLPSGTERWFFIRFSASPTYDLQLDPGWNLVCFPGEMQLDIGSSALAASGLTVAWEWAGGQYRKVSTLTPGRTVWLSTQRGLYLPVAFSGQWEAPEVVRGWNLCGVRESGAALPGSGHAFWWNGTRFVYKTGNSVPALGYWCFEEE